MSAGIEEYIKLMSFQETDHTFDSKKGNLNKAKSCLRHQLMQDLA